VRGVHATGTLTSRKSRQTKATELQEAAKTYLMGSVSAARRKRRLRREKYSRRVKEKKRKSVRTAARGVIGWEKPRVQNRTRSEKKNNPPPPAPHLKRGVEGETEASEGERAQSQKKNTSGLCARSAGSWDLVRVKKTAPVNRNAEVKKRGDQRNLLIGFCGGEEAEEGSGGSHTLATQSR